MCVNRHIFRRHGKFHGGVCYIRVPHQCRITDVPLRKDHSFRCRICLNRNHCALRDHSDLGRTLFFQLHILRDIHSRSIFLKRHTHKSTVLFRQSILFAPMCVNRYIFLNWLGEIKQFTVIFLRIPTFKLVTVRCWLSGRGDNSFIQHLFAGSLCLTAAVKAHSRGIMKFLRIIQHGIHAFNRARVRMSIDHIRDFLIHQHIPLCLRSRIMQYL